MNDLPSPVGPNKDHPFEVFAYEVVDSTQDTLRELLHRRGIGLENPATVVWALHQIKGRGRMGQTWTCDSGQGLLASVHFRPALSLDKAPEWGYRLALAVAQAVEAYRPGVQVLLKWPNDWVNAQGCKLGGLLIESQVHGPRLQEALVGFGLNLLQQTFGKELPWATSLLLEQESGAKQSNGAPPASPVAADLLKLILKAWSWALVPGLEGLPQDDWLQKCKERLWGLGQFCAFDGPEGRCFFEIQGLVSDGGLLVWNPKRDQSLILRHPEYRLLYSQESASEENIPV
jgi:biotin-[acetyl-CoA-carboxylase] ligase BirA-like protein